MVNIHATVCMVYRVGCIAPLLLLVGEVGESLLIFAFVIALESRSLTLSL